MWKYLHIIIIQSFQRVLYAIHIFSKDKIIIDELLVMFHRLYLIPLTLTYLSSKIWLLQNIIMRDRNRKVPKSWQQKKPVNECVLINYDLLWSTLWENGCLMSFPFGLMLGRLYINLFWRVPINVGRFTKQTNR